MGYYINPSGGLTKERWLLENGAQYGKTVKYEDIKSKGYVPLIWVDNGLFSALGIAYSKREFLEFNDPKDDRLKEIWGVPKDIVLSECPEVKSRLEEEQ
jgi:hypothetical protein